MDSSAAKDFSMDTISDSDGKVTPIKEKTKDKEETREFSSSKDLSPILKNPMLHRIESSNILMAEDNFIGISGLIGAGKTTLARELGKVLNLPVYYEPIVENEYLEDFYRDMKRYSFSFQIYLLNCRFRQHQQVLWNGTGGIQDRTLYEDSIFAKVLYEDGNMEEREYKTYLNLFRNMSNFMKKNTLIVHLDVKPEESLRRIKLRARGCETGITVDYLTKLYNAYEEFLKEISKVIPVIRVNYSKFKTAEEMAQIIKKEYDSMHNIKNVEYNSDA
jgi:deoxyadenosine kinase